MLNMYYVEVNAICIAILGMMIILWQGYDASKKADGILFSKMLIAVIVLCIFDMAARTEGIFMYSDTIAYKYLAYIGNFSTGIVVCVLWLEYGAYVLDPEKAYLIRHRKVVLGIIAGFVILIASTPMNNLLFSVNAYGGYSRGPLLGAYYLVTWTMVMIPAVKSAFMMVRMRTRQLVETSARIIVYILAPTLCCAIQYAFANVSIIPAGFSVSMLVMFSTSIMRHISRDSLTGINNSRELESYIREKLISADAHDFLYLILVELDDLKRINSEYGRFKGDEVLVELSRAMKRACSNMPGRVFLARTDTGEFAILGFRRNRVEIERFRSMILDQVERINMENKEKLDISVSIGFAHGERRFFDNADDLLGEARLDLYMRRMEHKKAQLRAQKRISKQ